MERDSKTESKKKVVQNSASHLNTPQLFLLLLSITDKKKVGKQEREKKLACRKDNRSRFSFFGVCVYVLSGEFDLPSFPFVVEETFSLPPAPLATYKQQQQQKNTKLLISSHDIKRENNDMTTNHEQTDATTKKCHAVQTKLKKTSQQKEKSLPLI